MNQTKRILSLLLTVCMLLSMLPTVLAAAPSTMTIADLASASAAVAETLESAITAGTDENGVYTDVVVPSEILVGNYSMGAEDYVLMAAQAINDIAGGAASSAAISYKDIALTGAIAQGAAISTINSGMILELASRVEMYGLTLGKLPTSFNRPTDGSSIYEGRLCIYSIGSIFAQTLAAYAANGTLPASVTFAPSSYTTSETSAPQEPEVTEAPTEEPTEAPTDPAPGLPVSEEYAGVIAAAVELKAYVDKYGYTPASVTANGSSYGLSSFGHLAGQVILNLANGDTTSSLEYLTLTEPSNPSETTVAGTITQTEYLDITTRTVNWNRNNGVGANYSSTSLGHLHHHEVIYMFCNILAYYAENTTLPSTTDIRTWAVISISGTETPDFTSAVFGNDFSAYAAYLVPTANCQSTNATIISVARVGMAYSAGAQGGFPNPSSTYEAMFNLMEYINDNTDYEYYSNTSRGALGTWNDRQGNCCDMGHLMNACARSLGVPGRYEHWYSIFTSSQTGHVWAALYCPDAPNPNINNENGWLYADPVRNGNYLGYQTHYNQFEYSDSHCAELGY